ncbi:MAG: hypothetical protein PHQ35_08920 [Phycisphaerae bacterium]|nr:hypothetical protein [Phycisphaerae bacterium]MDD5381609.1 hypothetical protein [Phycisphaerae bacterium]
MAQIPNFNLCSFVVGCKYTRCFTVNSVSGTVADYVLGERGAQGSPIPEEYYDKISFGTGVELFNNEGNRRFTVTPDQMVLEEKTLSISESLSDIDKYVAMARHLMTGTLSLMKNPTMVFLGMVWTFSEVSVEEHERFKHPVAESLLSKVLKLQLTPKEHPAEVQTRLTFRKKIDESFIHKEQNDYINIILNIRDSLQSELWIEKDKKAVHEKPKIGIISVDIQRIFDPQRPLDTRLFEIHLANCERIMKPRIEEILKGIGFGKEPQIQKTSTI